MTNAHAERMTRLSYTVTSSPMSLVSLCSVLCATQWRRYVYLFPLRSPQWGSSRAENVFWLDADSDANATDVHALLQPLVGKDLDYWSFGRDTPAGQSNQGPCCVPTTQGNATLSAHACLEAALQRILCMLYATCLRPLQGRTAYAGCCWPGPTL